VSVSESGGSGQRRTDAVGAKSDTVNGEDAEKKMCPYERLNSQHAAGKDYVVMAFVMLGVGAVLLICFVLFAPRMMPTEILTQFYYVVLVVWGLVCALVLFGVMKSYARLKYKSLGGAIELGGPAAFAALVVLGGFWLAPTNDSFVLTIRPHGAHSALIASGMIRVEAGNKTYVEKIDENGEVHIIDLSKKFLGATVKVLPEVDGYEQQYQAVRLSGDTIDLLLTEEPPPETVLTGIVLYQPGRGNAAKLFLRDESTVATVDADGRFRVVVHKKLGERVRVSVCTGGLRVYDDYVYLTGNGVEITARKPDVPCD
jgi:hypothetical protein